MIRGGDHRWIWDLFDLHLQAASIRHDVMQISDLCDIITLHACFDITVQCISILLMSR